MKKVINIGDREIEYDGWYCSCHCNGYDNDIDCCIFYNIVLDIDDNNNSLRCKECLKATGDS